MFLPKAALRWTRESIGYGLEEAADRIGISAEKLAAAERGERLRLRRGVPIRVRAGRRG